MFDTGLQVVIVHNFIRDKYRLKFPELESLVSSSVRSFVKEVMGFEI